ncbi:hypothetical protein JJB07_11380 [Tumebacillus sp. ITR2]|uniref:Uncharacterized protein n=1 Tax=Tumebacillus amylolyticus TaxID=2801339 RepID=A0ABS1JAE9_9BACL|nr:hypothetical protein [Tumebacillus amylolyticus]MBL0387252.1 hypothetical protein [Tumebacillus amylolyticus]
MNGKTKKHHYISFVASLVASAGLLLVYRRWGMDVADLIGFGVLIGISYAMLFKS